MTDSPDPRELAELFHAVSRTMRRRTLAQLEPWGITPHHARALRCVAETEPARLRDLADRLRIAARSATEVVDALQEKGLVTRAPDPHDRRATLVSPTSDGLSLVEQIDAARAERNAEFFGALSTEDRMALQRILGSLPVE
ncbi:MarR family winged helix-turn-helix transcriptional regulator [Tersicoccus solisilvae]|uniref:MarR family winged helix-turn-helix transcriptional regulator n=1 Tax=Tersicoccus solisilvae TaxID=1882339 RepID=UPI001E49FDDC|nr:MarR family transcriptional regulator [Tersicoccus solisilvae]